jgi:hypothetical protein
MRAVVPYWCKAGAPVSQGERVCNLVPKHPVTLVTCSMIICACSISRHIMSSDQVQAHVTPTLICYGQLHIRLRCAAHQIRFAQHRND